MGEGKEGDVSCIAEWAPASVGEDQAVVGVWDLGGGCHVTVEEGSHVGSVLGWLGGVGSKMVQKQRDSCTRKTSLILKQRLCPETTRSPKSILKLLALLEHWSPQKGSTK